MGLADYTRLWRTRGQTPSLNAKGNWTQMSQWVGQGQVAGEANSDSHNTLMTDILPKPQESCLWLGLGDNSTLVKIRVRLWFWFNINKHVSQIIARIY